MNALSSSIVGPWGSREVHSVLALFSVFILLFALSWPIEFSMDLWVFKDRGNLLNLDYLLSKHYRLGVDTYYSYGLLPVLIQHGLFVIFGRGPWPMIGCHVAYLAIMATAWTMILRNTLPPKLGLLIGVALSPIIVWINPNFPYALVQASMLLSLAFLLRGRLEVALAISAVGCWSVPTLTLLFSFALLLLIVVDWWHSEAPSISGLLRRIAPGALAYFVIALVLLVAFGWDSVVATALPFQGMSFYKAVDFGMFTSLAVFLHPGPESIANWSPLKYYLGSRVTWWILSTLTLFVLGALAVARMIRHRAVDPAHAFVAVCALIQAVFVFKAYGSPTQHVIYDPVLAAGTLVGIDFIRQQKLRNWALGVFIGTALLAQIHQTLYTRWLWTTFVRDAQSDYFFADPAWLKDWSQVLDISKKQRVFLLSYSTGVHHYFPSIETADAWTMGVGQYFAADKHRLLAKMRTADVVVEDLWAPTTLFDSDPDIRRELDSMCLIGTNTYFALWSRLPPEGAGGSCQHLHREVPAELRRRGEFGL